VCSLHRGRKRTYRPRAALRGARVSSESWDSYTDVFKGCVT
jgi:hypothetical protein